MTTYKRIMLSSSDTVMLLRALREYIARLTKGKATQTAWVEAEQAYRLAEGIMNRRRGARPHRMKAYEWFLFVDSVTPLRQMDKWIESLNHSRLAGRSNS